MKRAKELATKVLTRKMYHTFVYFYDFGNYIKQKSRWFREMPYYNDLIGIYMILLEVENDVNPRSHNVLDRSFDDVVQIFKRDWLSRIQMAMQVYYEKDKTPIADTMAKMMLLGEAQERNERERGSGSLISLLQESLAILANNFPVDEASVQKHTPITVENLKMTYPKTATACDYINLPDDYLCSICHEPFMNPMMTSAGSVYCKECIENWIKVVDENSPILDPIHRTEILPTLYPALFVWVQMNKYKK
jgi:hypothetical protein